MLGIEDKYEIEIEALKRRIRRNYQSGLSLFLLLKIQALLSGCLLYHNRRYLLTLKPHFLTSIRKVLFPCNIKMPALKAVCLFFH